MWRWARGCPARSARRTRRGGRSRPGRPPGRARARRAARPEPGCRGDASCLHRVNDLLCPGVCMAWEVVRMFSMFSTAEVGCQAVDDVTEDTAGDAAGGAPGGGADGPDVAAVAEVRGWIDAARQIVVLTGAGISTDS